MDTHGHTLAGQFELTAPAYTDLDGHPNRERMGWTSAGLNPDSHALRPITLGSAPELYNPQAVWFDASLGWVTPRENVVVKADFLDRAIPLAAAIAAAWAVGPDAAQLGASVGAGNLAVAGAVKAGVIAAASSAPMQLAGTGTLDVQQLLKTTLTSALTAGLLQGSGVAQGMSSASFSTRVMAMTAQGTVQGAIHELIGGRFRDGFTSAMANGLANEINLALGQGLSGTGLNPMQQSMAEMLRKATGSAIRALSSPDEAGQAFAADFLGTLLRDGLDGAQAWSDGLDQSPAETARLTRQNDELARSAHDQALTQVNARWGVDAGREPTAPVTGPAPDGSGLRFDVVGQRTAAYAQDLAGTVSGELGALFSRGLQAATGALDLLEIEPLANAKSEIQAYLDVRAEYGLSEAEIVVVGVLYAASEALFPTNALDFAGGIGKGVTAAGMVVLRKGPLDELAQVARVEAHQARMLVDWTRRESSYVKAYGNWDRKPAMTQDAAAQLAASLERAGQAAPTAYAPHHVVGFGKLDLETQQLLTNLGFTPNDASNGIWLSQQMHKQTYGDAYKTWVSDQFDGATTAARAREIFQDIQTTLLDIQEQLHTLPLNQVRIPWIP